MANDSQDFFAGGAPYFGFTRVGTAITGTITEEPHTQQQTDPKDNSLKTWPNGDPMLVLVITLATSLRNSAGLVNPIDDDDGTRTVWVGSQGMRKAIQNAMKAAGVKGLDVGGQLTVAFTGEGEKTNPALNAPKIFQAHYVPPNPSQQYFADQQAPQATMAPPAPATYAGPPPQAQYPPQQQYVAPPAQQPVPQAVPGQPTPEQIAAFLASQQANVAPPPPPPAPVAQPPVMTPEQIAAFMASQAPPAPPAPPANIPPGMTPEVWNQLTPEARAALANIAPK